MTRPYATLSANTTSCNIGNSIYINVHVDEPYEDDEDNRIYIHEEDMLEDLSGLSISELIERMNNVPIIGSIMPTQTDTTFIYTPEKVGVFLISANNYVDGESCVVIQVKNIPPFLSFDEDGYIIGNNISEKFIYIIYKNGVYTDYIEANHYISGKNYTNEILQVLEINIEDNQIVYEAMHKTYEETLEAWNFHCREIGNLTAPNGILHINIEDVFATYNINNKAVKELVINNKPVKSIMYNDNIIYHNTQEIIIIKNCSADSEYIHRINIDFACYNLDLTKTYTAPNGATLHNTTNYTGTVNVEWIPTTIHLYDEDDNIIASVTVMEISDE